MIAYHITHNELCTLHASAHLIIVSKYYFHFGGCWGEWVGFHPLPASDRESFLPVETCLAAKLLQSCPTLCNPIDSSPPGSPIPGILQARTIEWVASSFSNA